MGCAPLAHPSKSVPGILEMLNNVLVGLNFVAINCFVILYYRSILLRYTFFPTVGFDRTCEF